jgi:hypothetical protein
VESKLKGLSQEKLEREVDSEKSVSSEPVLTVPVVSVISSEDGIPGPDVSKKHLPNLKEETLLEAPTCEVDQFSEGKSNNEKIGLVIRKKRKKDLKVHIFITINIVYRVIFVYFFYCVRRLKA